MPLIQAMVQVDEGLWNAVNVKEEAVAAHISAVYIDDWTTGDSYDLSRFPVDIPLGHTVDGVVYATNDNTYTQYMRITVQLIDPDNIIRSEQTSATLIVQPGKDGGMSTHIVLDKQGTWQMQAIVEAEPT